MEEKYYHILKMGRLTEHTPNEDGSILLTTVILLLLLTILGLSGINTSSTDIQITRNYRIQKQNLALADAAVNYAKSYIVYGTADAQNDTWVTTVTALWNKDTKYLKDGGSWDSTNTPVLNEIAVDQVILDWDAGISEISPFTLPGQPNTQLVVYTNPNSTVNESVVIARSRDNNADVVIEAGFNSN